MHHIAYTVIGSIALAGALVGCQQSSAMAPRPSATLAPPTAAAMATQPSATLAPAATQAQPTAAAASSAQQAAEIIARYYQAIGQRQYAQAYPLWAEGGAASGQSAEQFAQGFAQTAGVQLALGEASAQGQEASVPVTITSVENLSGGAQEVRQYSGAYTLRQDAGGWKITSASIQQSATNPQPPAERGDPQALIQAYYSAINAQQYGRAYTYWSGSGAASGQGFAAFAQGFATTAQVNLAFGQAQQDVAAGSAYASLPVGIVAHQRDGSTTAFCGSYQLRRVNVEPFQLLGWSIDKAQIGPAALAASASQVLANGCGS
ncbi:nuclear transport factor 2 family protein [Chloroflexia bacterium SDU3-3]|nr:nuclear transport factor 2 family protein [Chloroflexia bacterium SDU3-3]